MHDPIAIRVAHRYIEARQQKEKKQHKVDRLMRFIRDVTGIGRGIAEGIAKNLVRSGRDIGSLARQKGWPIEDDVIIGPSGELALADARARI